ncbi:MAG: PAS domain S-box protein [Methylacidiphilales bacterium]|nr:PAS domain S-box protein [Candidatus Methylacidiphilales bacterium]
MSGNHQDTRVLSNDMRIDQAEARTEQAEARTEQAKTRIDQAEARTEQAEARTEQAETRTEQAKTRTEQAEMRTEQAETHSEQAIVASELRYRRLFETAQDGILILDAGTGQVVDANPYMKDLLGYSQEEFLGRKLWEIGPFKGITASKMAFEELQHADHIRYEDLPLETKEGRRVEVEFVSNAYLVDETRLIQCNIRDITKRKQSEQQLLWKTAFFEAQVNSALDGTLIVDSQGKKILQNQRMIDLWNIPGEFADEADNERRLEWIASKVKNPRQYSERVAYLDGDPEEISRDELELIDGTFFDRYSAPVRGKDGTNYGRIWTYRDITDRKRIEARFRRLVDSNAQGVMFWNAKGEVTGANEAFLHTVQYSREDLEAGRINWVAMTPLEYADLDRRALEEIAASGACAPYEKEFVRKDGSRVPILVGAATFEDSPEEGVCFVLDLTERKKLEQQFLRAQRTESIGTLAGGIAHDLNNILAPIMMSIEILKTISDNPQAKNILETIEISAKRGSDIVRQVLSFARGLEGERIEVQPKHLLQDIESIIKDTFPKNIRLQFSIPNDTWTIFGDPTQVHQILLNLCVNARDAMPSGGNLTINVENCVLDEHYAAMNIQAKPGRYVNITVTDSGTGIPPDLLDKIFEPFFTTKELNQGTGLGLSTVLAIVKSHNGVINVYSEPGKGTTFKIYLPAMRTPSEARKEQPEQPSLPRGNGETILLVDDEASILTITGQTLQAFGYRVLTALDGTEALAVYIEHKNEIAVVLTDMAMPILDGPATIRALMKINPAIKIIAASGLNVNVGAAKMSGTSVKHFLMKPYTAETLLKTLRAILDEV